MTRKPDRPLRYGWTTGACASAAAKAAYHHLLSGAVLDPVTIDLPRGGEARFPLADHALGDDSAYAAVTKDAGDDPDVTHGALIEARSRRLAPGEGVRFIAGEGIGVVTRPGLPLAVGEAAINPTPRTMIRHELEKVAAAHAARADVEVTISIPGGRELAEKTANPRLGIVGGLSVLGTTGIVTPYSCAAWIHSIHRGIDVARAAGLEHIAACCGSTSERGARALWNLPEHALIDMGDFVGGTLKYLRRQPLPRVTLAGGIGKMAKLAQGHLDLHSGQSSVDTGFLAALAANDGADAATQRAIAAATTALDAQCRARAAGFDLAGAVATRAAVIAAAHGEGHFALTVAVFDRNAALLAHRAAPTSVAAG